MDAPPKEPPKDFVKRSRNNLFATYNKLISECVFRNNNAFVLDKSYLKQNHPSFNSASRSNMKQKIIELYNLMTSDLESGLADHYLKYLKDFHPNCTIVDIKQYHASYTPPVIVEKPNTKSSVIAVEVKEIKKSSNNGVRIYAKYELVVAGILLSYENTKKKELGLSWKEMMATKGTPDIAVDFNYWVLFPNLIDLQNCMVRTIWEDAHANDNYKFIDDNLCDKFGGNNVVGENFQKSYGESFAKHFQMNVQRLKSKQDTQMSEVFHDDGNDVTKFIKRMRKERAVKETQEETDETWDEAAECYNQDNNDDMAYVSFTETNFL
jgi:hypothetical protein